MITRRNFLSVSAVTAATMISRPLFAATESISQSDPLLKYDAIGLASLVKSGEFSPREVVEATIRRIESLDGKINAVVTKTFEQAIKRASTMKPKGPLAGVPFLLKDNIDLAGVRNSHGSMFYKNNISASSAPLVKAYEAAGLVILGKTNMPEVGLIPSTESTLLGACHNPWNLAHSAGGSSGGSAAAVAAGYLPVAHATDGGGSIRIPSSCCGVFGLKPSRMRMLSGASDQTEFMADHSISRSVRDSALLFSLTQNRSSNVPFKPLEFITGPSKRRLKIGISMSNYYGKMPHKDVQKAIQETAKLCEALGHEVIEVANPINGHEFEENFHAIFSERVSKLVDRAASITGKSPAESGLLERFTVDFDAQSRSLGSDAIEKAHKYMKTTAVKVTEWMKPFDLLLTPVLDAPPPKLGYLFDPTQDYEVISQRVFGYGPYTPMQNALGLPAMSVPLGMSEKGLPIGSHFIARAGDEQTLFELAYELEQAKPWAHLWAPNSAVHL